MVPRIRGPVPQIANPGRRIGARVPVVRTMRSVTHPGPARRRCRVPSIAAAATLDQTRGVEPRRIDGLDRDPRPTIDFAVQSDGESMPPRVIDASPA
jgi:hypothetical protein